ncbi:unannotated protein [freshwater metagenome]|jgi:hypothetical protein|uniref:Unannotated protein n=1 Tax=freshwater metagenome TaxID=449393 RepID=A0A6J7CDG8_9ZZZZ
MLRRERVRARDIFRFGTGMIFTPYLKRLTQDENYLRKVQTCKND